MQQDEQFDENLYSRQVAVYGAETQSKLLKMRVFIQGLRGLGLEIAKNLILAGPKSVTISDRNKVEHTDLGSHFYATQDDIGKKTREDASLTQLKELNPYVTVETYKGELNAQSLSEFTVVVLCDNWDQEFIIQVNEEVRKKNHGFILCQNCGLFGSAFVDFSDKFLVFDKTGEEPKQAIIAGISKDAEGLVNTTEDKRHGFEDGDWITFREVLGMTEVNEKNFQIKVKSPYMFTIGDTSKFSQYEREGLAIQVKMPTEMVFKSFKASLTHPWAVDKQELDLMDWEKIGRPEQLHIAYNALLAFYAKHKQLPQLLNEEHANEILQLANEINKSDRGEKALTTELETEVVKNCSRFARAQITPITSFWGGIVAQEIVKFTGKFTPIRQWLHSEFFEALPEGQVNRTLQNKQYDDYIAIFGQEILAKLQDSRGFMVGAGALGCEFIKMFALMGLGVGPKGMMTVTDDDSIEISNLNRQFLFRKKDVGSNKSAVACAVGRNMNKQCKFQDKALRVGVQNEPIFNDTFWEGLDIVVNAVDNVHARKYIDEQCCYYGKPMFESGTLGTKCNSQLILPNTTQSYSESQDPPEETIPLCTLKNFPYQIEHTIQWARDYFQGIFSDGSQECVKYLENPADYLKRSKVELGQQPGSLRARLETLKKYVEVAKSPDLAKLVHLARNQFQDIFCNQIKQLLYCFPPDHKTSEGQLFWTNPKRPPVAIEFDEKDEIHMMFIQSAVNIFADIFGLEKQKDLSKIQQQLKSVTVQQYKPKQMTLKEDDKDQKEEKAEDDEVEIAKLMDELSKINLKQVKLKECAFEKDDPTNWHIEFLSSLSNLRARNYKIKEVAPFQVKLIAGKIIPALATTTALIVGAVGLELFKYVQKKDVSKMRNAFINIALPLFLFSEPLPPGKHKDEENSVVYLGPTKSVPPQWTAWDRIVVDKKMTFKQFIEYFNTQYKVQITSITIGEVVLFSSYPVPTQELLNKDIAQHYVDKSGKQLPTYRKYLDLVIGGDIIDNGIEKNADVAPVKYQYK